MSLIQVRAGNYVTSGMRGMPALAGLGLPRKQKRQLRRAKRGSHNLSVTEASTYLAQWKTARQNLYTAFQQTNMQIKDGSQRLKFYTEYQALVRRWDQWFSAHVVAGPQGVKAAVVQLRLKQARDEGQKLINRVAKYARQEARRLGHAENTVTEYKLPPPPPPPEPSPTEQAFDDAVDAMSATSGGAGATTAMADQVAAAAITDATIRATTGAPPRQEPIPQDVGPLMEAGAMQTMSDQTGNTVAATSSIDLPAEGDAGLGPFGLPWWQWGLIGAGALAAGWYFTRPHKPRT